jgi:low temperature requirement protein LtrA
VNIDEEPKDTRTERHASWAELFFDLVAVAGVAALAHVLGPELGAEVSHPRFHGAS